MTEQDNSLTEGQQEKELWPGRYFVEATVEKWPHRGYIFKDVWLSLFQTGMTREDVEALLEPLGFTPDMEDRDYLYTISYVEATFSEEQADELIAFLEKHDGTKAEKRPAEKPYPGASPGFAGISAMAYGSQEGHYPLYEEEDYNLSFKASAYYSVEEAEYLGKTALAGLKEQIDINISSLSQAELEELLDYLEEKKADEKQALINSINQLLTGMTVEQLEMIETYIARIE